jgi:hypothetical protein
MELSSGTCPRRRGHATQPSIPWGCSRSSKYRRRAEHAAAGYLLHGPDEARDADYSRGHGELIELARKTGRLRQTDESVG